MAGSGHEYVHMIHNSDSNSNTQPEEASKTAPQSGEASMKIRLSAAFFTFSVTVPPRFPKDRIQAVVQGIIDIVQTIAVAAGCLYALRFLIHLLL
jgi:hypothetical protein